MIMKASVTALLIFSAILLLYSPVRTAYEANRQRLSLSEEIQRQLAFQIIGYLLLFIALFSIIWYIPEKKEEKEEEKKEITTEEIVKRARGY